MRHICAVGLQWGDEGKGKIVDVLTEHVDVVVRYQGGANAGHTIYIGEVKHVLHHLPTGVLRPGTRAVLGNGMVLEPCTLVDEIDALPSEVLDRLYLSDRAHLVLPHHALREARREESTTPIGTTLRGIGPAYEDKYARSGIRLGDLLGPGYCAGPLASAIRERVPQSARGRLEDSAVDRTVAACRTLVERLADRITDTATLLARWHESGDRFLFEGAQGVMLDVDFGTYPFVTSSSPCSHGIGGGAGFSPRRIDHVLGITKVYCTRVGAGPFPSEADAADAAELRHGGGEFGTTTGRPRRCGWLDLPALRYALRINDVDSLALTKADVLAGRDRVPVVAGYELDGVPIDDPPARAADLARVRPVREEWPGWREATPRAMAPFVRRLEEAVGRPVTILSSGPRRADVFVMEPFGTPARGGTHAC